MSGHKVATGFQRPWEARIGRFNGKKNVFLGLFETEEEAARQYDRALIISKGLSAKTNFDIREYEEEAMKQLDERRRQQGKEPRQQGEAGGQEHQQQQRQGRGEGTRSVPNLKEMLYKRFASGEFSCNT